MWALTGYHGGTQNVYRQKVYMPSFLSPCHMNPYRIWDQNKYKLKINEFFKDYNFFENSKTNNISFPMKDYIEYESVFILVSDTL